MSHWLDDDGKHSYAAAAHRASRRGATLLLSCFSNANPSDDEWSRPEVSEQTVRDVLGGAGWDVELLEPAGWRREIGGKDVEMAFWHVRAQCASGTCLNYSACGVFEAQKQLGSIPAVSRRGNQLAALRMIWIFTAGVVYCQPIWA